MNKKTQVKRIFDSISKRYDLLNHLLSAGIDFYWRKKSLKLTKISSDSNLLDVACGTGDFAIAAKKFGVEKIIGADLSINMLKEFNKKKNWSIGTTAFGVRNFYDIPEGFRSFNRILRKKGKVTILEFRLPKNFIVRGLYNFYFNKVLPLIGKIISKDQEAYTYLPESVNAFDENVNIAKLLSETGFIIIAEK
jgi:demethylmenaquinone methyltransferase/2-methoxy-6-polyprenyl-1,4-benzoquinol methylase